MYNRSYLQENKKEHRTIVTQSTMVASFLSPLPTIHLEVFTVT